MWNKRGFVVGAVMATLAWGCASQTSNLDRGDHLAQRSPGGSNGETADEAERREVTQSTERRLSKLQGETARVASRLEHEGTVEQRAAWGQELSDIDHDGRLLRRQLREVELSPSEEWAEQHARLSAMVEVLVEFGEKAAGKIDRALDADRAAAP